LFITVKLKLIHTLHSITKNSPCMHGIQISFPVIFRPIFLEMPST
jgi:hypothetical protein